MVRKASYGVVRQAAMVMVMVVLVVGFKDYAKTFLYLLSLTGEIVGWFL